MSIRERKKELEKRRNYLGGFFAIFVVVPILLGPFLFMHFESNNNPEFSHYTTALVYNYQIITGAELTNYIASTNEGKIVVGIFSLLYLVFFGFISAIIITCIEIAILKKGFPIGNSNNP